MVDTRYTIFEQPLKSAIYFTNSLLFYASKVAICWIKCIIQMGRNGLGAAVIIVLSIEANGQDADSIYALAEQLYNQSSPTYQSDEQAIKYYNISINLAAELSNVRDRDLRNADCYHKIGTIYHDREDFYQALNSYHKSVEIKKNSNVRDSLLLEDYTLIGSIYYYLDNYDSAECYYQKAESIWTKYKIKGANADLVRLFNALGILYETIGNYNQAKNYFDKALMALDSTERDYELNRAGVSNNMAMVYSKLGDGQKAIENYKRVVRSGFPFPATYLNLGIEFLNLEQYDSARYYLRRSTVSDKKSVILDGYNNLAALYARENQLDSAVFFLEKSIQMNRDGTSLRNIDLSYSYFIYANVSQAYQRYDLTLHYYQLALISTTFDFNDSTVTANPQDITQAISLLQLFEALKGKAAAWSRYYQQDQDPTKLNHSLTTYQLAIRVAQHIQKTYDNDEAKLFLVNKVAPIYEEAIATAVQLYELTDDSRYVAQAFQFSEASKASVLTEGLRDVKIKSSGQVNDSLVQEEHRIKQQITALRLKLVESQDSAQNERYRQQLNDQEIALARTIKYLQKDEHYYQRKYQPDSLDIAALQRSLLSDDQALLEYFMGADTLYLFLMTSDALQIASAARTPELDSALQRTQRHLYDHRPGQGEDEASLAMLYRYLIAPVADALTDARKLIIVPDGPLHYLPFDLLSVDGQRTNYLLHTHTLHYGYSASLLRQAIDERRGYPTESVLAMAPFTGGVAGNVRSQDFNRLRDSQAEVESVGGSIYTEGRATKRRFLRMAGSYNVLHLATHATVNDEDPSQSFIAFYPQQRDSVANYRLYTHELYNMRLDSVKLVVLSACEAGNGQLVRGEGVMSLARAFAYAGCPNIITTLWKADDRSSAQLTTRLHQYLKQGWEKDEALRQAKLDYLNDPAVHPAQKAPYYWANFVFIGDPVPIYEDYRWWWVVAGLFLVLVVGGMLLWRQRALRRLKQTA